MRKEAQEVLAKYGDIIDLPHHQSDRRAHMSLQARAAQFAPFAALTGYDQWVARMAKQTEESFDTAPDFFDDGWTEE